MPPLAPMRRPAAFPRAVALLSVLVAALVALLGLQSVTASPASAAALTCDPNTVYGISTGGLSSVDVTTGTTTFVHAMPDATNGLGVSLGGTHAYAFSNGSTNVMDDYDANTGGVTPVTSFDTGTAGAIRGAVDPSTGIFYYGGNNTTVGGVTTIRVGAYDPATGAKLGRVATITSSASGSGGDFAFTRSGTMFVLIGTSVERVDQTLPTTTGNAALTTTPVTVLGGGITASPGLAFAANGYLYANSGSTLVKINPITGATVGTVPMSGSFSPSDLASCTYPSAMTASVDVGERMHASDQFGVAITGGGLTYGNTGSTSGSATGTSRVAGPVIGLGGGTYTATQSMPSGSPADYTTAYSCTGGGGVLVSGTSATASASVTFTVPTSGVTDIDCTFTNTPVTATVQVTVALGGRADPADQFVAAVTSGGVALNATTDSTTTGSGSAVTTGTGTTGVTSVVATRGYALTTAMAGGSASVFGQYGAVLTCTDSSGLQPAGLPTGAAYTGSATITPVAGAVISCAVTATPTAPTVTLLAALAEPRADDADQFAVAVHDGGAGGAVLNRGGAGTTAGTGSTVTSGTGTSAAVPLAPGQSVTLTAAPTAHAGAYAAHLTCVDGNGFQTALPTAAAFTGTAGLAPVAGAAIVCTVTSGISDTTLAVTGAFGAARYDDGDQLAVAIRTGGPAGTLVSASGAATTAGTGSTVTTGTGITGVLAATAGTSYTITGAVTDDAARYGSTLTCTDAHGVHAGLPDHAAFTGSTTLTVRAGSAISCAVTTTLLPPALTIAVAGPSAVAVGATGTWQVTVPNGGGATAPANVAVRLPAGVVYNGVAGSGWSCTATGSVSTGQLVACDGPAIRGGTQSAFSIDATPRPGASATAQLAASVAPLGVGTPSDPATCTGSGCAVAGSTVVGSGVRLRIDADGPAALSVGVPVTYALTVTDVGTGPAGSAVILAELPADFAVVSTNGGTCTVQQRAMTCTVAGPLAAGDAAVVHVRLTPLAAAAGDVAVLRATVDPAGSASPAAPATCTTTSVAAGCAVTSAPPVTSGVRLQLGITGPTHLTLGVPASYAVTVTDTGTGPASSATVSLDVPAGLVSLGAAGASCTSDGELITCSITGPIDADGLSTFTIVGTPAAGVTGSLRMRGAVDVTGGSAPGDPTACTATDAATGCAITTALTPGTVTLRLTATATPLGSAGARVVAGDRVAFRYTVTNTGADRIEHLALTAAGLGAVRCASTGLDAGESTTCTTSPYRVTQADVDHGTLTRNAVATASVPSCSDDSCSAITSNQTQTVTPARVLARVSSAQTVRVDDTDHDGVASAGEVAHFTVVVTNTGTVTLHGLRLADAAVHLTCPSSVLAVGASMRCTGSRTVTAADVAAGRIRSTATATGASGLERVQATSNEAVATVATRTDRLATTGSVLAPALGGGLLLLLVGSGLLLVARRGRA